MEFRKGIISGYPIIFKGGEDKDEQGNQRDVNEFSERSQFNKQWGWYHSIYRLSGGDVSKLNEVVRLPIHQALTFLSYEIQKDKVQYNEQKRQLDKLKRK